MSDRAALLASICAHPDEDTPRLVYADWLDENGDGARAAFIRAQVETHRLQHADTAANTMDEFLDWDYHDGVARIDWSAVDADLAALVAARKQHEKPSLRLKPKSEGLPRVKGVQFRVNARGFFDTIDVYDTAAFFKHADAIFRAAPITRAEFNELTEDEALELVAAGHLARFRELWFEFGVEAAALRVIGSHRDAAGVRTLDIMEMGDGGAATVEVLADGHYWTGLRILELTDLEDAERPPRRGQMADLLGRKQFRGLRKLVAWESNLDDSAVRAIARNLLELRRLDASMNGIGDDGAAAIAESRTLRNLRWLNLSSCRVKDGAAVAALINSARLPALTVLWLDGNGNRGPSAKELAKPGRAPGLRVLNLGDSQISGASLEALARCPAAHGLRYLNLNTAGVTDEGLEKFLEGCCVRPTGASRPRLQQCEGARGERAGRVVGWRTVAVARPGWQPTRRRRREGAGGQPLPERIEVHHRFRPRRRHSEEALQEAVRMNDHDALLRAICAHPDDDTPRLIFADYLDENDQPARAAFVRAQVELARTPAWELVAVRCRWHTPDLVTGVAFRTTLPRVDGFHLEWVNEPFRRGFGWWLRVRTLAEWNARVAPLFEFQPHWKGFILNRDA